jgi:hypothetical protein
MLWHVFERLGRKGIPGLVKRNRHPALISVTVIDLVWAGLTIQDKPILDESGNELAGRETAQVSIVNGHGLEGDGHLRLAGNLDLVSRSFRDGLVMVAQAFYHQMHYFFEVVERLFPRIPPAGSTLCQQGRTPRRPAVLVWFDHGFENIGLHVSPPERGSVVDVEIGGFNVL